MRRRSIMHPVRLTVVAAVAVAALTLPTAASAAPASTSFAIVGYEYAFTQTVGTFAGTATGNAGDAAAWNATVEHDPLGSTPTYVDGGSFEMLTVNPNGGADMVRGTFVYHGGTITTIDPGANCTNQRYLVTDTLDDVATTTSSGGSGTFTAVLTHYRFSLFGRCVIYKARVAGSVRFAY
jgi:hypothetical protein